MPKVTKALKLFFRLKPLLHSISKEQPIWPVMYGVKTMRLHHERKSDAVKVHHEKERWVESSPEEREMG